MVTNNDNNNSINKIMRKIIETTTSFIYLV